jgi:hypothetical protein
MEQSNPSTLENEEKVSVSKPKIPRVMLTTKQMRILEKLVKNGALTMDIKSASSDLKISRAAIYNSNKRVFQNFIGLLDAMINYYPVFDRRLRQDEHTYSQLRRLARLIRKDS